MMTEELEVIEINEEEREIRSLNQKIFSPNLNQELKKTNHEFSLIYTNYFYIRANLC